MLTDLTQQQWRLVIQLVRLYRARPIAKLSELSQGEGRLMLYLLEQRTTGSAIYRQPQSRAVPPQNHLHSQRFTAKGIC